MFKTKRLLIDYTNNSLTIKNSIAKLAIVVLHLSFTYMFKNIKSIKMTKREQDILVERIASKVIEELKAALDIQTDKAINISEVSAIIGRSSSWIYKHIEEIPHRKVNGRIVFSHNAIQTYLRSL